MDWLIPFLLFLGFILPPVLEAIEDYLEQKGILPSSKTDLAELRLIYLQEMMRERLKRMEE